MAVGDHAIGTSVVVARTARSLFSVRFLGTERLGVIVQLESDSFDPTGVDVSFTNVKYAKWNGVNVTVYCSVVLDHHEITRVVPSYE